jgi:hypothetical protein
MVMLLAFCTAAWFIMFAVINLFGATMERWLLIELTRHGGVDLDHFGCRSIDQELVRRHTHIKNVAIAFVQGYDEEVLELYSNSFHDHTDSDADATVLIVSTPSSTPCFDYCTRFISCTTPTCMKAKLNSPKNVFLVDAQFCEHRFPFWQKPHLKRFLIVQQWIEQNPQYEKIMLRCTHYFGYVHHSPEHFILQRRKRCVFPVKSIRANGQRGGVCVV